jgi:hypothetical protein
VKCELLPSSFEITEKRAYNHHHFSSLLQLQKWKRRMESMGWKERGDGIVEFI